MKDQPRFEVDDTTTSYSPPRTVRPRWVDGGRMDASTQLAGDQVLGQHWYDPHGSTDRAPHGRSAPAPPSEARGPRARGPLVVGAVALAGITAVVAAIGTVGFLAAGGWLGDGGQMAGAVTVAPSQVPSGGRSVGRPDTTRIAAEVTPAIVTVIVGPAEADPLADAMGSSQAQVASGIVFAPGGWILTNRHVVCEAGSVSVLLADGRRLTAQVYGLDSLTDLAIIQVDATDLAPADIGDSTSLRLGQMSLVFGTSSDSLETTVAGGVVSALGRDLLVADPCLDGEQRALRNVIQTDAQSEDGSSGGALVDAAGAVVGISTVVAGVEDATFAIPINIAKPIMEQAVVGKPLSRPWMGITYTALNPAIASAHGLPIDHGAWLRASTDGSLPAVVPDGPADHAGLQDGDILTAVDDQRIDSSHSLDDILSQYRPEDQDPVEISVLRDGTPLDKVLTLGIRTSGS
ncbi:MAG: trypsin-like peptidase domain-containing protein [Chloroflexota bacterium]